MPDPSWEYRGRWNASLDLTLGLFTKHTHEAVKGTWQLSQMTRIVSESDLLIYWNVLIDT